MASYDDVLKALQAADAAGNAQDAQQLAIIADQMRNAPQTTTLGQKALGAGEAALSLGTTAFAAGASPIVYGLDVAKNLLAGTPQKIRPMEQSLSEIASSGYSPKTAKGQEYTENVFNAIEASKLAPTPLLPNRPSFALKIKAKVPTAEEIKGAASQMYKKIDDAGVVIQAEPFNQFVNKVKTTVGSKVREARQPQVVDALKQLDEASGSVKTLQKMQDLRESISGIKMSGNASERMFAGDIVKELDDFMEKLDASKLIAPVQGDVEAIKLVPQARELWKQARKSELLDEIYRKAEIKSTDPYNDVAFATKLRSEFKNLATNKTKLRGFTEEEVKAIEQAAKGGKIENALRAFGQGGGGDKFSYGGAIAGGGLSSFAFGPEFGNAVAGPIGAYIGAKTVPAIKGVSRMAAGQLGKQNLQNAIDLIKTGGNPYAGLQLFQGNTAPLNAAGLLAPYITNPDDLKSLLGQ
jgi:hypothetical protein